MEKIIPITLTTSEPLLTPEKLSAIFPLTLPQQQFIEQRRKEIVNILEGKDPRLLLIMGPCSIHNVEAAMEYASLIKTITPTISDTFVPVMRVYFEKPRSVTGWKGIMHDPDLDGTGNLNKGLQLTRQLLHHLAELRVAAAAEILDPISTFYFSDLLSWGCIGARTTTSQLHRQVASGLPMPVGFKNTIDGNVSAAIDGIRAARYHHSYIGINHEGLASTIKTKGNLHGHLVLRGGHQAPNYHKQGVANALHLLEENNLKKSLIIDCSHDNSQRNHDNQPKVFRAVIEQITEGSESIRGVVLESYIHEGKQALIEPIEELTSTISITDACIDWATTVSLINEGRQALAPIRKTGKSTEFACHNI